jgi:translation elongation factor EF-4
MLTTPSLSHDSYDRYRGVISLVSVQAGGLKKGDRIMSCFTRKKYEVVDIGIMHPEVGEALDSVVDTELILDDGHL